MASPSVSRQGSPDLMAAVLIRFMNHHLHPLSAGPRAIHSVRRTALLFLSFVPLATAATNYWDSNGALPGLGGPGLWDTSTAFWNDITGTEPPLIYAGGATATAQFGGTAGTVTIPAGSVIDVNHLAFATTGYSIESTGTGALNLTGTSPAIDTGAFDASIRAALTGSAGFTKTGAGTLSLSGTQANILTGTTQISAGTLELNKSAGTNALGGTVTVNGGTLHSLADHQIADSTTINLTSGALSLDGKIETVTALNNSGGAFTTGTGRLTTTGTSTWSGGTTVIGDGGYMESPNLVITGGSHSVEGGPAGGVLRITGGGAGLEMTGATLSMNADAVAPGRLILNGNVTIHASSDTSTIASGLLFPDRGLVDLGGGLRTFNVADGAAATDLAMNAVMTNGGFIKEGAGTMLLSRANTYDGPTIISGGTLLMGGSNRIPDSSDVTLNGGTLSTGFSGFDDTAGVLAVTANSIIDFGVGGSNLTFLKTNADQWTGQLQIWNWSGDYGTTGGTDQLLVKEFGSYHIPADRIQFFSDNGVHAIGREGASFVSLPGGGWELVPIPEASTLAGMLALVGLAGWRERRHFFRCADARRLSRLTV